MNANHLGNDYYISHLTTSVKEGLTDVIVSLVCIQGAEVRVDIFFSHWGSWTQWDWNRAPQSRRQKRQFGRPTTSTVLCCLVMPTCCLICILGVGTTGLCDSVAPVGRTRLRMGTLHFPYILKKRCPDAKTVQLTPPVLVSCCDVSLAQGAGWTQCIEWNRERCLLIGVQERAVMTLEWPRDNLHRAWDPVLQSASLSTPPSKNMTSNLSPPF